ncbi:hypothetical protein ZIOFF_014214 [Zingiber officinale]|uniref:Uncharacterized protein n=1 Tax=Zingiber officinale TaxID=94328 RepID=A0A8J5LDI8_ZINOF|nr:hypothetical protein ZIOFF_014214 [Zingiber officinale]
MHIIGSMFIELKKPFWLQKVSILTRGYEQWSHGEANLLITRGLVERLSNTPNVGFAYEVQGVVDYLTSHDVRALPGRSRIAARSSAAWKFGLDIGVGVIDCDYRDPLLDLKLPEPSWEDEVTDRQPPNFFKLLPTEKHVVSVCLEDTILLQERLSKNHAETTSPWAFVPRSMNLSDDTTDTEDDFLSHIQYLANLTTPITSPEPTDTIWYSYPDTSADEWLNPFSLKGGRKKPSQLIATGFEMDYPSLRRIMKIDNQSTQPVQPCFNQGLSGGDRAGDDGGVGRQDRASASYTGRALCEMKQKKEGILQR